MAIQKDTPTSLVKAGCTYVVLPTESAKLIKDPVSFAIWAYLLSKPENWIVRNSEIQDRFGIGRDKTTSAIGHLRDIGLVWDQFSRDESGKVCGRSLVCSSQPNNAIAVLRNSRNTVEPYYGKDGVLVSIDSLAIKDKSTYDLSLSAEADDCNATWKGEESAPLIHQPENCPHQEIIALWHELMPELTSVKTWNEKRAKMLKARWNGKDMEGNKFNNLKFWRKYFEYIRESDWLMGKTGSGWSATLEWVITESNFNKIIEGTYHNAN